MFYLYLNISIFEMCTQETTVVSIGLLIFPIFNLEEFHFLLKNTVLLTRHSIKKNINIYLVACSIIKFV